MIKNKVRNLSYLYLSLVFTTFSCTKNTKEISYLKPSSYYPLEIGNSYIYEVDSIVFNDFDQSVDSFKFQIIESYTDTFRDIYNELAYKIERKKRNKIQLNEYEAWGNPQIWWVNLAKNQSIQRVENNLRFVNLVTPIQNDFSWKGNAFNLLAEWDFRYAMVNESFENFDSTLTVIQREIPENLILKEYYEQKFAKNIGLIYYHYINVESKNNLSIPLMQRIENGVIYTQKLIQYKLN
jgi:hypothetical protein